MNIVLKYMPTVGELWRSAKRNWLIGIFASGVIFVGLAAAVYMLPRKFQSEAKLFVRLGWPAVTLDATAQTGQTVSLFESRENDINSNLEMLRSREVFDEVVSRLGANVILHGYEVPALATLGNSNQGPAEAAPLQPRVPDKAHQMAVDTLEKSLEIWTPKRTNVIGVRCEASSPELAQAIVHTLLCVFHDRHLQMNSTQGSYQFFVEQEKLLRDRWQSVNEQFRAAKDALGVTSLEGKRNLLQSELGDTEQKLLAAESEVAASVGKIASLEAKLKELPQFTETARTESANVAGDAMRTNFYTLQMKEKELLSKYTEVHPQVIAIREQVAALEKLVQKESPLRVQSTTSLNPAWQQTETALLTEKSSLDSVRSRLENLVKQRDSLVSQMKTLNTDEIRLTELQQQVTLAEQSHRETSTRLEQARVHQELANERVTNVNIVQPASYVSKAISPNRSLLLALSLVASGFTGIASIVALSLLERNFRSLADLAKCLELPVITFIPPMPVFAR